MKHIHTHTCTHSSYRSIAAKECGGTVDEYAYAAVSSIPR